MTVYYDQNNPFEDNLKELFLRRAQMGYDQGRELNLKLHKDLHLNLKLLLLISLFGRLLKNELILF